MVFKKKHWDNLSDKKFDRLYKTLKHAQIDAKNYAEFIDLSFPDVEEEVKQKIWVLMATYDDVCPGLFEDKVAEIYGTDAEEEQE